MIGFDVQRFLLVFSGHYLQYFPTEADAQNFLPVPRKILNLYFPLIVAEIPVEKHLLPHNLHTQYFPMTDATEMKNYLLFLNFIFKKHVIIKYLYLSFYLSYSDYNTDN